jgi:hypothetical protein
VRLKSALPMGLASFAFALMVLAVSVEWRLPGDQRGFQPAQPITFSHALHAGDNKIDCQFCHSAAEKSRHAGIPAANTCMKCHEQVLKNSPEIAKIKSALASGRPIEWVRVHELASFVRFDHSRHVNSGVACDSCHGPVQGMARVSQNFRMSMGDCLDCHRGLSQGLNPAAPAGAPSKKGPEDCGSCHY